MCIASIPLYPLGFEPIYRRLIWGGRRMETLLGRALPPGEDYAESWEVADHPSGVSVVAEGPLAGVTLRALMASRGEELLGQAHERFPLLVKILDAHQTLSVQVHPDDRLGREMAGESGKTEAWVILHAEPGSVIYAGLREGVDRAALVSAVGDGTVERTLHRFEARPGDCVFIPAGTVHAIGGGIVLAEVQQTSDTTYRLFDWNRPGPDGSPRALHVEEAFRCIDFDRGPISPWRAQPEGDLRERLACCEYFEMARVALDGAAEAAVGGRCSIVMGLGGEAELSSGGIERRLRLGETLLLPAALGPCRIRAATGTASVLECRLP